MLDESTNTHLKVICWGMNLSKKFYNEDVGVEQFISEGICISNGGRRLKFWCFTRETWRKPTRMKELAEASASE